MFVPGITITWLITLIVGTAVPASAATPVRDEGQFRTPPPLIVPADNKMTRARIALGKTLFFDPRLFVVMKVLIESSVPGWFRLLRLLKLKVLPVKVTAPRLVVE